MVLMRVDMCILYHELFSRQSAIENIAILHCVVFNVQYNMYRDGIAPTTHGDYIPSNIGNNDMVFVLFCTARDLRNVQKCRMMIHM